MAKVIRDPRPGRHRFQPVGRDRLAAIFGPGRPGSGVVSIRGRRGLGHFAALDSTSITACLVWHSQPGTEDSRAKLWRRRRQRRVAAEALLAASALLANDELPGLWVVLTGYDPELVPGDPADNAAQSSAADCVAVALALIPRGKGQVGPLLSVGTGTAAPTWPSSRWSSLPTPLPMASHSARWNLPCGGSASWDNTETAVEICL